MEEDLLGAVGGEERGTIYCPSEEVVRELEAAEAARRGARPKLRRSAEQPRPSSGWRSHDPMDSENSRECIRVSQSQSWTELPQRLEQLQLEERDHHGLPRRRWSLAPPAFTYPERAPPARSPSVRQSTFCSAREDLQQRPEQPRAGGNQVGSPQGRPPPPVEHRREASPVRTQMNVHPPPGREGPAPVWPQYQWMPAPPVRQPRVDYQAPAAGLFPPQPPPAPQPAAAIPPWGPLPVIPKLEATFDGNSMHLEFFLSRIGIYVEQYGHLFRNDREIVAAITSSMNTGDAAAFVALLYREQAPEIADLELFIQALRDRFEDRDQRGEMESRIVELKQGRKNMKDFVWEYRRVAAVLTNWPQNIILHYFKRAIDPEVLKACEIRGVAEDLNAWFDMAIKLDRVLYPKGKPSAVAPPKRPLDAVPAVKPAWRTPPPPPGFLKCYRCGGRGHRAGECATPPAAPRRQPVPTPRRGRGRGKPSEPSRIGCQVDDPPPPASQDADGPPGKPGPDSADQDPMVSAHVPRFVVKIRLTNPHTGEGGDLTALVDTGCTRCLISSGVVEQLGVPTYPLREPIHFEQVDGSLIGGQPAAYVTGLIRMEMAHHKEYLRFIVSPFMKENVILGLSWLDRWRPTISWDKEGRKLLIAEGPLPPSLSENEISSCINARQGLALASQQRPLVDPKVPAEYQDLSKVFSESECDKLPPHRDTDCAIEIEPGATLPRPRLYAMSPREMKELREYIDTNLARGFIEPANSPLAAPVMFKEKKDHGLRLCVDFSRLNAVCKKMTYPLPLMKDLLNHLAKGKIFTKLDLREAYYRVRIREGDEWKTAFNCPLGSYQYKVMPFGLHGAPAVFMQLINETLHDFLYKGVLVYLDDILIYSETIEEHIKLVRQVLQRLLDAELYVKLQKSEFHKTSLDYLGYRISTQGLGMDPSKVKAVMDWQAPQTRKQLQSFLGFANFYRQFIPNFAEVALPLTELLKTGPCSAKPKPSQTLSWTMDCQKSFEHLKRLFGKEPILQHPDPDKMFVVQADASDVAIAAVLLQYREAEHLMPCAYISKKLTEAERRWAVWEKEAYAVKWALQTWRHFLEGASRPFEVWTDHRNLQALLTPRKLSPKQVRWAQYFHRFNFKLKYIPGEKNQLADALSRKPQYNSQREEVNQSMLTGPQVVGQVTTQARKEGSKAILDPKLTLDFIGALESDPWFQQNKDDLTIREQLAWKGGKLYVPEKMRLLVLQRAHDSPLGGHFGFLKTLHFVRRQFWWPKMKTDIQDYVGSCNVCATNKTRPGKPPGLLQQVASPSRPWEEIAMDFVVDLPESKGHNVIWTVIDLFSKQAHFIACKGLPSAKRLADLFVKHIYRLHGVPKRIISDRGVQFTAVFWKEFLKTIGSTQGLSSGYHPETAGSAERVQALLEQYLRCYIKYQQNNWSELLPFAEVAYNNTVHTSTGQSPFQVATGVEFIPMPELPAEPPASISVSEWMDSLRAGWQNTKKALIEAGEKYKKQADKHRGQQRPFKVGDLVYLSTKYIRLNRPSKKLGPTYLGPYPIVKVINPVTVRLLLPKWLGKIHPVFHSRLLKFAKPSRIRPPQAAPPAPTVAEGHRYYEVQGILDSRIKRNRLQYLIHWKGYPESESSWVNCENIQADRLIREFHAEYPNKPGNPQGAGVVG